jgi:hypothetical protein
MALVMLIFIMPFFYAIVINNIRANMVQRELKEIADYVSNTLANLYFLVNSTNCLDVNLTKELIYLPSTVENSVYMVEINGSSINASNIRAYLKDKPSVSAESWLNPGLYRDKPPYMVESGERKVVAGCCRNSTGVYVWIGYG